MTSRTFQPCIRYVMDLQRAYNRMLSQHLDHVQNAVRSDDAIDDCLTCDGYVLDADEWPLCPSCAREQKGAKS